MCLQAWNQNEWKIQGHLIIEQNDSISKSWRMCVSISSCWPNCSNKDHLQLSFVHGQSFLCTYPKPQQDTVQVKHAETTWTLLLNVPKTSSDRCKVHSCCSRKWSQGCSDSWFQPASSRTSQYFILTLRIVSSALAPLGLPFTCYCTVSLATSDHLSTLSSRVSARKWAYTGLSLIMGDVIFWTDLLIFISALFCSASSWGFWWKSSLGKVLQGCGRLQLIGQRRVKWQQAAALWRLH